MIAGKQTSKQKVTKMVSFKEMVEHRQGVNSHVKRIAFGNKEHTTDKPHFYILKLGFTGYTLCFLSITQKHRLWVLV